MAWDKFGSKIEVATKFTAMFVGASYAFGYIIWNIYLQTLGFYPDLLQGRFILTGMLFIILAVGVASALFFLKNIFKNALLSFFLKFPRIKMREENLEALQFSFLGVIFGIFLVSFPFFTFPKIPGYFGGGQPRFISVIGEEGDIAYLNNFGIGSASKVQTWLLCSAYEDKEYIVVILEDRILSLKKDRYRGFSSLPSIDIPKYVSQCNMVIADNLMRQRKLNVQIPPSK